MCRRMDEEGGPVTMSYGRRESFVLADDMTDFFGSQKSIDGRPYSGTQLPVRWPKYNVSVCLTMKLHKQIFVCWPSVDSKHVYI